LILNIGFCGALTSKFAPGDLCFIGSVVTPPQFEQKSVKQPPRFSLATPPGNQQKTPFTLATVKNPVFTTEEKNDLYFQTGAELVDMEGAILCQVMKDLNIDHPFTMIKITGDLPGEGELFIKEQKMRNFFSTRSLIKKFFIIIKSGTAFFTLYKRKRTLQKILYQTVLEQIKIIKNDQKLL